MGLALLGQGSSNRRLRVEERVKIHETDDPENMLEVSVEILARDSRKSASS